MNDITALLLKSLKKNKQAQTNFILYFIKENWDKVCGISGAKHSQPTKLQDGKLFINTDNPAWSHNLMMLKRELLRKINKILPEGARSLKVKELVFFQGEIKSLRVQKQEEEPEEVLLELEQQEKDKLQQEVGKLRDQKLRGVFYRLLVKDARARKTLLHGNHHKCALCGLVIESSEKYCTTCKRNVENGIKRKIGDVLKNEPWISYKECYNYVKCDIITFTDVRNQLVDWAISEACQKQASELQKTFAVMLARRLEPQRLTPELVEETIQSFKKRRYKYFFATE